jgi:hypothetical protein
MWRGAAAAAAGFLAGFAATAVLSPRGESRVQPAASVRIEPVVIRESGPGPGGEAVPAFAGNAPRKPSWRVIRELPVYVSDGPALHRLEERNAELERRVRELEEVLRDLGLKEDKPR